MSVTATDAKRRAGWSEGGWPHKWPLGLALLVALQAVGCAEAPLPNQGFRRDDCLRQVSLANLKQQLQRCSAVVEAFPNEPGPLNDRYLLHSLAGNDAAACEDLRRAIALAQRRAPATLDPQLKRDLQVREPLCSPEASRPKENTDPS